jgi:hypothetical protein
MQERRQAERIRLNLPARWQSLLTQDRGSVCDLSATGCFVLTAGEVKAAELVRLEMDFGSHPVFAWGKVVYRVADMGFALRFVFSEENERRALTKLIEKLQRSNGLVEEVARASRP